MEQWEEEDATGKRPGRDIHRISREAGERVARGEKVQTQPFDWTTLKSWVFLIYYLIVILMVFVKTIISAWWVWPSCVAVELMDSNNGAAFKSAKHLTMPF